MLKRLMEHNQTEQFIFHRSPRGRRDEGGRERKKGWIKEREGTGGK